MSPVPYVASSSASIRQSLKTFGRDKLLRKCRDLLDPKDRQVEKLSSLERTVKELREQVEGRNRQLEQLQRDQSLLLLESCASHEAQVKAIQSLHDTTMQKKQEEVKQLTRELREEKKYGNKVSY